MAEEERRPYRVALNLVIADDHGHSYTEGGDQTVTAASSLEALVIAAADEGRSLALGMRIVHALPFVRPEVTADVVEEIEHTCPTCGTQWWVEINATEIAPRPVCDPEGWDRFHQQRASG